MGKSDRYQYKIVELNVDAFKLGVFSEAQGIGAILKMNDVSDELKECQRDLMKELHKIINTELTAHQKKVIKMVLEDKTQMEIAEVLGITQSAVHKAMHGNISYKDLDEQGNPKRYGGIIHKIQKYTRSSEKIALILKRIERIKEDENE